MRSSAQLLLASTLALVGFGVPGSAQAQNPEGCDKIQGLVASGDYMQALEELGWCERGISDLHYKRILEILEVPILGYEPGEGTAEAVMGFSTIEITHSKGDDDVRTSLASGLGTTTGPMSGLGALAGLAGAFGVRQAGVEQVRIGRNTGQLEEKSDGEYSLMVTMAGGQILTIEGTDGKLLQDFAARVIELLDSYLNG